MRRVKQFVVTVELSEGDISNEKISGFIRAGIRMEQMCYSADSKLSYGLRVRSVKPVPKCDTPLVLTRRPTGVCHER